MLKVIPVSTLSTKRNAAHTQEKQLSISVTEKNPSKASQSSWLNNFTARAAITLATLGPIAGASSYLFNPPSLEAANNPKREKAISDFAHESWKPLKESILAGKLNTLPTRDILWNNLQAAFTISDDTLIESIEPLRREIIEKGATNHSIPARVVHSALYSTAVSANRMNTEIGKNEEKIASLDTSLKPLQKQVKDLEALKAETPKELKTSISSLEAQMAQLTKETQVLKERKEKLSQGVFPYLGKVIVDIKNKEGTTQRKLVSPSKVLELGKEYFVDEYESKDIQDLAGFVFGSIGDEKILSGFLQELKLSGNDIERRNTFLTPFLYTKNVPKEIIDLSKEWVFGNEQLKEHKKFLDLKTKTPVTPVPISVTQAPSIKTPGIPSDKKSGTLDALLELDHKLVGPLLPYPFAKDKEEQEFLAKNILILAKSGDESATAAAAQWFGLKHYSDGAIGEKRLLSPNSNADYIVMQALAISAQKNKLGFEVLKRVAASTPHNFFTPLFKGSLFLEDTYDRRAGVEIIKVLTTNKEASRDLMIALANKNSKPIWNEPASPEDIKSTNSAKALSRKLALVTMAFVDGGNNFVPFLRTVVKNPLSKEEDIGFAINGLTTAKDKESLEFLISLGMDETLSEKLRTLALESALFIDSPSLVPEFLRLKAQNHSPFSPTKLAALLPRSVRFGKINDEKRNDILGQIVSNPIHARISLPYNEWLNEQESANNLRAKKGDVPLTISDEDKLSVFLDTMRLTIGGKEGSMLPLPAFKEKVETHLDSMVKYLNSCKENKTPVNMNLAISMINVLSKSNHQSANKTLVDIVTYPELYVANSKMIGSMGIQMNNREALILKMVTIEALGGTIDLQNPDDSGAKALHAIARKGSLGLFRGQARTGLYNLAHRYEDALFGPRPIVIPETAQKLFKARETHAKQVLGHMEFHQKGLQTSTQIRLNRLQDEYDHARVADKFGATKDLLLLASEAAKKDKHAPIIRSVMHALITNEKDASDFKKYGFEPKQLDELQTLFKSIDRQEWWLGKAENQKYTGKGTTLAVLDVGYAYPVLYKELEKKITYPGFINWSDLVGTLESHPTGVTGTAHKLSPNANVLSYSLVASTPQIPFRPENMQDAGIFALGDMARLMLEDKANIDVINHSYVTPNFLLMNEEVRRDSIDLYSAFMETLSRMDVKHSVGAGNFQGVQPITFRQGALSETTNLGLRFTNDGKIIQPEGIFISAAHDKYANRVAEFSSHQDPLRVIEAVKMLSEQGVHVITPYLDGAVFRKIPVNGTSFSAPHKSALMLWGIEARKQAKLDPLSNKQWEKLFDSCIGKFPDSEPNQGGLYLDVTLFLERIVQPIPQVQGPQPVPKVEAKELSPASK